MEQQIYLLDQANLLVERLERIYVDSIWARRSSGLRGNLLKWIEYLANNIAAQQELPAEDLARFQALMESGYAFLEKAAREHLKK